MTVQLRKPEGYSVSLVGIEMYFIPQPRDTLLACYTDGSKSPEGVGGAGFFIPPFLFSHEECCFSLCVQVSVFQAEIYAIYRAALAIFSDLSSFCQDEVLFLSDSQGALKALASPKVASWPAGRC